MERLCSNLLLTFYKLRQLHNMHIIDNTNTCWLVLLSASKSRIWIHCQAAARTTQTPDPQYAEYQYTNSRPINQHPPRSALPNKKLCILKLWTIIKKFRWSPIHQRKLSFNSKSILERVLQTKGCSSLIQVIHITHLTQTGNSYISLRQVIYTSNTGR